ncbi:hypothetical protein AALO_G00040310 [Alosa alosa]|uniref:PDZ domain-containing protein n=1 Tax=Alosa alosa TaxID=278164 RepID=A0AAV6HAU1_9TELE|nr:hypothetical protein AALO_G00040310 [Alosa alosa]
MTSTMSFRSLVRLDSQDSNTREGSLKKKSRLWHKHSLRGSLKSRNGNNSADTMGRQLNRTRSNSLVDYSDPLRTTVVLEKQDNEAYGFEVQTYGVQLKNTTAVEMCTFVCTVQQDSAAENAGLSAGDVIVTINGISIEGSSHQDIISLIRESTNVLKMETVSGTLVKRIELEKKLSLLKQNLRERWVELQALTQQEKRLTRGNLVDSAGMPSLESLISLASPPASGACASPATAAAAACSCPHRPALTRTRSISSGSPSPSPTCDASRVTSLFGTLPRKGRKGSVRQQFFKFINHSVEEEEAS